MKENVTDILAQLGIVWKYLFNGVIGAFVWALHTKSKFWDAIRQTFIGGIVAAYATPVIAAKTSIQQVGFLSFVVGMVGLVIIDALYQSLMKKIKLLF